MSGHWLWGSLAALQRAPHSFPAELGWRDGGLARFRVLHRQLVALTDPAHARQVLVTRQERYARAFHSRNGRALLGAGLLTLDGDAWLRRRRQVLPAFRRERLAALPATVHAVAARMLDGWEATRRAGGTIAIGAAMQRLTLGVMAQALLSSEVDDGDTLRLGRALQDGTLLVRARNLAPVRSPSWWPSRANRALRAAAGVIDRFVAARLGGRAAARPDDMVGLLRATRDPETGAPFAAEALHDETKTLLVAGFETTTQALTWTLHLLSRHPAVAPAWHDELDRVLAGRAPGWSDLAQLPLTRAIIDEAMRLYPPVYTIPRRCIAADEIAGEPIRPGTIVLVSVFGIHRSAALWPEPEAFRPARFAPGADWPAHAFLPFGVGKHVCIGADFAAAEMVMTLAAIGQRYRLEPADDRPVGMVARISLAPDREIGLRLLPR